MIPVLRGNTPSRGYAAPSGGSTPTGSPGPQYVRPCHKAGIVSVTPGPNWKNHPPQDSDKSSLEEAIRSAIEDVRTAGYEVTRVEIDTEASFHSNDTPSSCSRVLAPLVMVRLLAFWP